MKTQTLFGIMAPLLAALTFPLSVGAAGEPLSGPLQCPPKLTVQQKIETAPEGWQKIDSNKAHRYANVSFYDGHPDQMALLAPNGEKPAAKGAKTKIDVWNLTPFPEGHWVACEYTGTTAVVAMKLPDTVTRCEVEYDPSRAKPDLKRWACFGAASKEK